MAIAEGSTIPFTGPEAVDVAVLETFEYAGPEQEIVTETREFSPVCPYSGLPDFATLRIVYVPGDRCIELKSLKYYVTSYPQRRHLPGARHGEDRRGPLRGAAAEAAHGDHDLQHARRVRHHLHGDPAEALPAMRVSARRASSRHGLTTCAGLWIPLRLGSAARAAAGSAGSPARRRHRHDGRGLLQVVRDGLVVGVALRVVGVEVAPRAAGRS